MNCPHCNAPVFPGAQFCTNCRTNFSVAQNLSVVHEGESKREKRYKVLLTIVAVLFVADGIVGRIISRLAVKYGYGIYENTKPYYWFISIVVGSLPLVIGILFPKTSVWKWILVIAGSIWLAYRIYELISVEFFSENPFVYFEF